MQRAFTVGLQSARLQVRADSHECAVHTSKGVQCLSFKRPAKLRELAAQVLERTHRGTFSPDGRLLVVTGRNWLGVWDWASDLTPTLTAAGESATPFFTPDGSELFAYWNDAIGRWHLTRGSTNAEAAIQLDPLPVNKSRRLYSSFLYSNNLALTGQGGVEFVALTNVAVGPGRLHDTSAGFGCVSPDGQWLVLRFEWQSWLHIYRLPEMQWFQQIIAGSNVMNFTFTPQSDELAVATRAGVEFYDTTTWQRARLLPMPMDRYANLIFAPDGRSFWVSRDTRVAELYDTRALEVLLPLPAGTLPLAVSPDGRHVAVSVNDRRVQVWNLAALRAQFRELGLDWATNQ